MNPWITLISDLLRILITLFHKRESREWFKIFSITRSELGKSKIQLYLNEDTKSICHGENMLVTVVLMAGKITFRLEP